MTEPAPAPINVDDLRQILDALADALIESTHAPECETWKRGFEAMPMEACNCWRQESYTTFKKHRHLRRLSSDE